MNKRELALKIAESFVNLPYRWGGNDPLTGFDCSGLVIEILQSVGVIESKKDYTSEGLKNLFPQTDVLEPGNLLFYDWDEDSVIDHIEMIAFVDDQGTVFSIGASGGDSSTLSESVAAQQNAYVKIRQIRWDFVLMTDPFKK